eukprot:5149417-Amphidinium_carterae.1
MSNRIRFSWTAPPVPVDIKWSRRERQSVANRGQICDASKTFCSHVSVPPCMVLQTAAAYRTLSKPMLAATLSAAS